MRCPQRRLDPALGTQRWHFSAQVSGLPGGPAKFGPTGRL